MFRIGDRVCSRYHMSKEGTITEMRQVMWVVKFVTDSGEEVEMKAQDVMRAN